MGFKHPKRWLRIGSPWWFFMAIEREF
jgi:hypothetical protein